MIFKFYFIYKDMNILKKKKKIQWYNDENKFKTC